MHASGALPNDFAHQTLRRKIRIRIRIEKAKMSLYSAPKAPLVSSERYEAAKASSSPGPTRHHGPVMLPIPRAPLP